MNIPLILTMRQMRADDRSNILQNQKNVNILEFGDDIWIHHEKCIQMNTNMPSTGSSKIDVVFGEIVYEILFAR